MLNKNKVLTFTGNGGIIKVSKFFIWRTNDMTIIQRLNANQKYDLEQIAKKNGYFYRGEGSQELTEEGLYKVYIDFDTFSVATINPKIGERIASKKSFAMVNEIFFRGQKIWPLQEPVF